ncbi:MAG: GtrA family protein [Caulobacteraceae bacterium]|nr:GtrA family protein [Caulobacter sp.]
MIQRLVRNFTERRHAAVVRLTLEYALFAAIATGVNLGVQWLVVHVAEPWLLQLHGLPALLRSKRLLVLPALVGGTGAGLVVKYVLDKHFIFRDRTGGAAQHVKKFGLYAVMGLATTVIFWGAEIGAAAVSRSPYAMYVGGALGLLVGYVVKYRLDRRFVFIQASNDAAGRDPAELGAPAPAR